MGCCCTLCQMGLAAVTLYLSCFSDPACSCLQPTLVLLPTLAHLHFPHPFPSVGILGALRLVLLLAIMPGDLVSPHCSGNFLPPFGTWRR